MTMSTRSAKRRKTIDMASASVPAIDSLPPELLEEVFSWLSLRTLRTARLVCIRFHDLASRYFNSLELSVETLRSHPETTVKYFPNLTRVGVFGLKEDDLVMLAQSPVAPAITHLRAVEYLKPVPRRGRSAAGSPPLPLPNLMSLTVGHAENDHAYAFPQNLRELDLKAAVDPRTANLVTRLTNLTYLQINLDGLSKPLKGLTALTALQRLDICGELSHMPFVAELTLLTHLQFQDIWTPDSISDSPLLAPLTRLRRLVHLGMGHFGASLERQVIASAATFTCLRSLDLKLCRRPERSAFETALMRPFARLTSLRLESEGLDASFLPRFTLRRLRDLYLDRGVELDRDGVVALGRATGLTNLHIWLSTVGASVGPGVWERALSRMSRLRALFLGATSAFRATFSLKAISRHTKLTKLQLRGRGVTTNAGLAACVGLKRLRVLWISVSGRSLPAPLDRMTPETLCAVAKLPGLRKFDIFGNVGISGGDLTDGIRARVDAKRRDMGLPPVRLNIYARP